MTEKEILKKAFKIAQDNGYRSGQNKLRVDEDLTIYELKNGSADGIRAYKSLGTYHQFIYDHEFAKALWEGNSKIVTYTIGSEDGDTIARPMPLWEFQLQKMVIANNPITYLGENI